MQRQYPADSAIKHWGQRLLLPSMPHCSKKGNFVPSLQTWGVVPWNEQVCLQTPSQNNPGSQMPWPWCQISPERCSTLVPQELPHIEVLLHLCRGIRGSLLPSCTSAAACSQIQSSLTQSRPMVQGSPFFCLNQLGFNSCTQQ